LGDARSGLAVGNSRDKKGILLNGLEWMG
jgi:hypothetical protein